MDSLTAGSSEIPAAPPSSSQQLSAADRRVGPIVLALIGLLIVAVAYGRQPPPVVPENAPPADFSAARAMRDVRQIARLPHPLGSAENARVREYLLGRLRAMGLEPEVLEATVTRRNRGPGPLVCGWVHDIVTRIKGTANSGAVMLVAHYDSVPTGPGAGDDAAAVAALLETVRALRASPPLRNDLILLLTDGEELGLLGAKGFVENYPHLADIKAVFNFEARGDEGPSLMFETSDANAWLIDDFERAAPYPAASSFFETIYKRIPNDTDFTIFKGARLDGLNFAFIGELPRYHTALDNPDLLDPRSVQHHGSYALALARDFGNRRAWDKSSENAVFFSIGGIVVHYSERLALPLLVLSVLLMMMSLAPGLRAGILTHRGIAIGLVIYALAIAVALIEARLVWHVMDLLAGDRMLPAGTTYGGVYFAAASIALVISTLWAGYELLAPSVGPLDLGAGALTLLLLLAAVSSLSLPGASYLFIWPMFFAAMAFSYAPGAGGGASAMARGAAALLANAPGIVILFALITAATDGTRITLSLAAASAALDFGPVIPYLSFLTAGRRWTVPAVLAASAVVLILTGDVASGFDEAQPRPDSIFYRLDADTGHAEWASVDKAPDAWNSQFLGNDFRPGSDGDFWRNLPTIVNVAPAVPASPPTLRVVKDSISNGIRSLTMQIASARSARTILITLRSENEVLSASVGGKPFEHPRGKWRAAFCGVPDNGFDLDFSVKAGQPLKLRVADATDGMPAALRPRPTGFMASPACPLDSSTIVSKTFDLSAAPR